VTPTSTIYGSEIKRGKSKNRDIPSDLLAQWEKDRAKKAENKRARQQARLELAADPLSIKKGGKKGHKAMLAAARLDPSAPIANRVVDMITLVQQIRRFLADVGGRSTMVLPPMEKGDRARVHDLANAFHMKSVSRGHGKGRYTTLSKTTMSGVNVNEKGIGRIVGNDAGKGRHLGPVGADKGKGKSAMPRHKDGDEVGKACLINRGVFVALIRLLIAFSGSAEDWTIEHWFQDVELDGLDRRREDWSLCGWTACTPYCRYQKYEVGTGRGKSLMLGCGLI
jgi:hypothetical protein